MPFPIRLHANLKEQLTKQIACAIKFYILIIKVENAPPPFVRMGVFLFQKSAIKNSAEWG